MARPRKWQFSMPGPFKSYINLYILVVITECAYLHGDMVILSCVDVTVVGVASVTVTMKVKTPVAVGLPEITPVLPFRVNPVGSGPLPVARAQV
jgi:hypothetical protein